MAGASINGRPSDADGLVLERWVGDSEPGVDDPGTRLGYDDGIEIELANLRSGFHQSRNSQDRLAKRRLVQ